MPPIHALTLRKFCCRINYGYINRTIKERAAFLIIALGIYFIISYLNAKLSDKKIDQKISKLKKEKSSKGSLVTMFLGSLILIFGIINLFEGSLIIASLISILIGGGTIYYSFKKFKKSK